jgi:hypothetical protein
MKNNICIITSVIDTQNNPLSYSKTRSVFNIDERFNQTKKTILSVKEKIPNITIFIIECSNIHGTIYESFFKENSDIYINLFDNEFLRNNIFSSSKSLGEGTMTIEAFKYIVTNNIPFDNLFKISGRYHLTENFKYHLFDNDNNIFKKIDNNDVNNIFTALYKINNETLPLLYRFLSENIQLMYNFIGYEILFGLFLNHIQYKNVVFVNPIGLYGFVTVDGSAYNG